MQGNQEIQKYIEKNDNILVDCFGTIIWRNISEKQLEELYFEKISENLNINSSYLKKLWKLNKKTDLCFDGRDEKTFKEIVDEIYLKLLYTESLTVTRIEFYNLFLEKFIEVEKRVCYVNTELIDLLFLAKKMGKQILCVSDFYLPQIFFKELFNFLEIDNLFNEIIVSSDIGKRKSTGEIYKYIKEKLCLDGQKTIMIGDNKTSDYIKAKENNLEAFLYKKHFFIVKPKDYFNECYKLYKENSYLENYVFVLYLFCEKLYKEILKENSGRCKKIYFMSREGELLKKLFELYLSFHKNEQIVETEYLYVSRQSTFLPSLESLEVEEFITLRKDSLNLSINSFLKNLNIFKENLLNKDFDLNTTIKNFFSSTEFKKLKENKEFKVIYENERKRQQKEILSYFKKIGFNDEKEIFIVDIGWKGSIQDNIFRIYKGKKKIKGFYYGLLGKVFLSENNSKIGLIFSDIPIESCHFDVFKTRYRILERIAYASHGTCIGYFNKNPKLGFCTKDEEKLYKNIYPVQKIIEKNMRKLILLEKKYPFSDKVKEECIAKIYKIHCLDLNNKILKVINDLDHKMHLGFGTRNEINKMSLKEIILSNIKYSIKLSNFEKIQKIIIILYKFKINFIAFLLKKIFIFKEKITYFI